MAIKIGGRHGNIPGIIIVSMNTFDAERSFFGLSAESSISDGRFWLAETSPASIGTLILSIQTVTQASIILGFQTSSVDTSFEIQQGAITSGGSGVTFLNPNFNFTALPDLSLTSGITIDTPGSIVWAGEILGTPGQGNTPNTIQEAAGFFILKPNTNYAITITNNDTATNYIVDIGYIETERRIS